MPTRLAVLPSLLPAVALLLTIGGQVKEPLETIALIAGGLMVPWTIVVLVVLVVQLVRRASWLPWVVALALTVAAGLGVVSLLVGTPLWVQQRAEPAIQALELSRTDTGGYPTTGSLDGDFPSALRAALETSGHCLYKPRDHGYRLVCLCGPFSRCGYDRGTRRWSGLE